MFSKTTTQNMAIKPNIFIDEKLRRNFLRNIKHQLLKTKIDKLSDSRSKFDSNLIDYLRNHLDKLSKNLGN